MNKILPFTLGVSFGAVIGMLISKSHFEKMAQEEINAIREHYGKRMKTEPDRNEEKSSPMMKPEITVLDYVKKIKEAGYIKEEPRDIAAEVYKPYVIAPENFREKEDDGYSSISLTYYSDGVLADDADHPMNEQEIENVVGRESLEHFGEYEEDSVHVRNDRMKCDFEILIDPRTFDEAVESKPYLKSEIEEET